MSLIIDKVSGQEGKWLIIQSDGPSDYSNLTFIPGAGVRVGAGAWAGSNFILTAKGTTWVIHHEQVKHLPVKKIFICIFKQVIYYIYS